MMQQWQVTQWVRKALSAVVVVVVLWKWRH
jgi:hypothetical protein